MQLLLLDRDTELAETVLARPSRVLPVVAGGAAALLVAAAAWAYFTEVDRVVKAPARVRPST